MILPGGEPFLFSGGSTGCLLIHGFTASPQEMRGLGRHLSADGHTVLGIRLPGHATRPEDLARCRWRDWVARVEDGYWQLTGASTRVVLLGLSLGGALALLASTRLHVDGVVAMSTPLRTARRAPRLALRIMSTVLPCIPKRPAEWYDPSAAAERVAYSCYPTRAVAEVGEVTRALGAALGAMEAPLLLIHSREDRFVPPANSQAILEGVRSKDKALLLVDHSTHVITCDAAREEVFRAAASFVRKVAQAPA